METLRQLKIDHPDLNVIVISSQTVVGVALEALKLGAYDYITKGHDDTVKIRRLVEQFIERKRLSTEVELLREQLRVPHGIPGMIGESAGMGKVLRLIKKPSLATYPWLLLVKAERERSWSPIQYISTHPGAENRLL